MPTTPHDESIPTRVHNSAVPCGCHSLTVVKECVGITAEAVRRADIAKFGIRDLRPDSGQCRRRRTRNYHHPPARPHLALLRERRNGDDEREENGKDSHCSRFAPSFCLLRFTSGITPRCFSTRAKAIRITPRLSPRSISHPVPLCALLTAIAASLTSIFRSRISTTSASRDGLIDVFTLSILSVTVFTAASLPRAASFSIVSTRSMMRSCPLSRRSISRGVWPA